MCSIYIFFLKKNGKRIGNHVIITYLIVCSVGTVNTTVYWWDINRSREGDTKDLNLSRTRRLVACVMWDYVRKYYKHWLTLVDCRKLEGMKRSFCCWDTTKDFFFIFLFYLFIFKIPGKAYIYIYIYTHIYIIYKRIFFFQL